MTPQVAHAHVEYVVESSDAYTGTNWALLANALFDPLNLTLIILVAGLIITLNFVIPHLAIASKYFKKVQFRAVNYNNLRSWILRLSLGISLVGAGFSQSLISPATDISGLPLLALFESIIGFLLLAGLFIGPAAIIIILLYLIGLTQNFYLIGNLETPAAAIALLVLANARPGIDHLMGIPYLSPIKAWNLYSPTILRFGVGAALVFLAFYEKILNPGLAVQVVNNYNLANIIPVSSGMWTLAAGIIELLLGLLLIAGYRVRTVATVTVLVLALSFFYFGEDVYSHVTLFGVLSVLFITGAGKFSIDSHVRRKLS